MHKKNGSQWLVHVQFTCDIFLFFFLHIKILIYISHVKMCKTVSNLQLKKQIPCDFVCHGLFLYMEILIHTW